MSRLLRWSFDGLCLFLLLACVLATALWRGSYRGCHDELALRARGAPYLLRSEAGTILVLGLPPENPERGAAMRKCFARFDNATLSWYVFVKRNLARSTTSPCRWGEPGPWDFLPVGLAEYGLRAGLTGRVDDGIYRTLYDRLNDPQRFALAHVLLTCASDPDPPFSHEAPERDAVKRRVRAFFGRLRIDLPPDGDGWDHDPITHKYADGSLEYIGPAAAYDPAQIPELRDFWFKKLAVPVGSVPWSAPTAALALVPLLWLALRVRFLIILSHRRRRGLCLRCGYDLAGNTGGRCSECGVATRAEKRGTSVSAQVE